MVSTTFIYGLKDPLTDEIRYVGKSNKPVYRLSAHITDALKNKVEENLHRINWIKGLLLVGEKPTLEILEEVSINEWEERECYHISKYSNLTNVLPGGSSPPSKLGKPMSQECKDKIGQAQIGNFLDKDHKDKIRKSCSGEANSMYGKKRSLSSNAKSAKAHFIKVAVYDAEGVFIRICEGRGEAAKLAGCSVASVSIVLAGNANTIKGFIFRRFEGGSSPAKKISKPLDKRFKVNVNNNNRLRKPKLIGQYDLDGNLIKVWPSLNAAARGMKINSGTLSQAINNKGSLTVHGFIWKHNKDGEFPKSIEPQLRTPNGYSVKKKPVKQFSLAGQFIKVWDSVGEAAESIEVGVPTMTNCLRGRQKTSGGFYWEYV